MATLHTIVRIPELLTKVIELSGTTKNMSSVSLYGHSWKDYGLKERVRQNMLSALQCVSRECRVYGLRWMNPGGLSLQQKNLLLLRLFMEPVSMESDDTTVSMDSDSDSELDTDMLTDSE